ncbi:hypothetical protein [Ureibacillus sinduriensis]|uniref:Uncharacterized protein n=1 Tax=Ureibacillus sinduriensis BLB-1 = JCM 15800 TaxID=1384057 RepID=A0A0A3HY58_9BACL|nr:hypothetical protein [Ureibacillus sinduriensis]KGR76175.1 hypothetical protein CD33_08405 [Ureibacillus sinduriensis BLB-1 = JCM 15800]
MSDVIKISTGMNLDPLNSDVVITIEGDSKIPLSNDDLKVKAIIALLNSIDIKHYHEANLQDEGYKAFVDIINSTKEAFGLDII